ncbi:MAG: preprotein translocase subunit SecG [Clostridia bacterium]|nr:preprotein translocase subunit SecG [Clostridia bacterium]
MIVEYILLAVLLLCAIFIVAAVTIQKSSDEGLSGTIAGGSETYYGKDKSVQTGRTLRKWTIIVGIIFAIAVAVVYIMQPDYAQSNDNLDYWQKVSEFSSIFS